MGRMAGLALAAFLFSAPIVEASQFSEGVSKVWTYAITPVNCLSELSRDLMGAGTKFVMCFLSNMNPGNLIP